MRKFIKGNSNDDTEREIVGCRKAISRALQASLLNQIHLTILHWLRNKSSKLLKFTASGK